MALARNSSLALRAAAASAAACCACGAHTRECGRQIGRSCTVLLHLLVCSRCLGPAQGCGGFQTAASQRGARYMRQSSCRACQKESQAYEAEVLQSVLKKEPRLSGRAPAGRAHPQWAGQHVTRQEELRKGSETSAGPQGQGTTSETTKLRLRGSEPPAGAAPASACSASAGRPVRKQVR